MTPRAAAGGAAAVALHSAPSASARSLSKDSRRILDKFRLEEIASHLLRRAHFAAEDIFAREFADESITPRQKAALVVLYQNPGLNQNALADRLFMDRNTVAEMVKRLATGGLIERQQAADDQRAYRLFLAADGEALLDRVMPRDMQVEQKVLERLPAEYRPLFIKCLRLIAEPSASPASSDAADADADAIPAPSSDIALPARRSAP